MQAQPASIRVLIADDDRIFTSLAAAALVSAGYQAVVANDGVEALEQVRSGLFHLIIVDLDMPRIDGFRLIPLLRSNPRCRRAGILVVTTSRKPDEHAEAISLGADAVQIKPVDWRVLPQHVATVLTSRDCQPTTSPARPTQYFAVSMSA